VTIYLGSKYFKTSEYLKDREIEYPLSPEFKENMKALLDKLDVVRVDWGRPLLISSGYRPGRYNQVVGGAKNSAHLSCEAVDVLDRTGDLADFLTEDRLIAYGLYLENPARTPGWCHLQTRATKSGARIFNP
jgi:hypothetical protein